MMRMWSSCLLVLVCLASASVSAIAAKPPAKEAPAPKKSDTGISWKVEPATVVIHLDGKKLGTAAELEFTKATPGKHTIRLVRGGDEEELEVQVQKGQILQFIYAFED